MAFPKLLQKLFGNSGAGPLLRSDILPAATDYLVMPDYPISAEDLAAVKSYRQSLRDVPEQKGFPTEIEWPVAPAIVGEKE
jgi:hypothetical protein